MQSEHVSRTAEYRLIIRDFSFEVRIIVAGSQKEIPADAIDDLIWLLQQASLDWDYIIRIANRNAVLPLLTWNLLSDRFSAFLPKGIRQMLEEEFKVQTQRNLYLTYKLSELVSIFRQNGIEVLPFKGPILADQAYGNFALRRFGDLDVLVRPRQFEIAVDVLLENGFRPLTKVSWFQKRNWFISRKKDINFADEKETFILELHWKLSGSHFGLPNEINHLWERVEFRKVAGLIVPNLSYTDLLIYLCLHGARHGWERFGWICDVNELIGSKETIDWDAVVRESRRVGCENVVILGLQLVNRFFDSTALPSRFKDQSDPIYSDLVIEIHDRIFSPDVKPLNLGDRYLYHLKLKEWWSDRWKLHVHYILWYIRLIFTPNQVDRSAMKLPWFLKPFYYLTRPIRLTYIFLVKRSNPATNSSKNAK